MSVCSGASNLGEGVSHGGAALIILCYVS